MDKARYCVIFEAKTRQGADKAKVKSDLAQVLGMDASQVEDLFARPGAVIREGLDEDAAWKMQKAIMGAGALCRIQKEKAPESDTPPPPPSAPPVSRTGQEAGPLPVKRRPVSLRIRASAAFYTYLKAMCIELILLIPILLFVKFGLLSDFDPSKGMYSQLSILRRAGWTMDALLRLSSFGVVVYAYLVVPVSRLVSWGQSAMGIEVFTIDGEIPNKKAYVLRFLGVFLTSLSGGLLLIWQVLDKEHRSLADRLSGTRLALAEDASGKPGLKGLGPFFGVIALGCVVGPLFAYTVDITKDPKDLFKYEVSEEEKAKIQEGIARHYTREIPDFVAEAEKRFFEKNNRYSDNIKELIAVSGKEDSQVANRVQMMVETGALRIFLTPEGYTAELDMGRGPKMVQTQSGFQEEQRNSGKYQREISPEERKNRILRMERDRLRGRRTYRY